MITAESRYRCKQHICIIIIKTTFRHQCYGLKSITKGRVDMRNNNNYCIIINEFPCGEIQTLHIIIISSYYADMDEK